jgi:SH3-like domain-containing protein
MRHVFCFLLVAALCGWVAPPVPAAERMAVKVDVANIRSGPDDGQDVIWQVEKYHPLMVLERRKPWFLIKDFEGDRGWIHSSLLDDTRTVVVKGDNCNVRAGPGTENDILFKVNKGIPFKVLEKKGRWLHVEHGDGDAGWIFDSLVW